MANLTPKLTPAEHEEKKRQAYQLSIYGHAAPAIAKVIGVSPNTTKKLITEALAEVRKQRDGDDKQDLERYLAEQNAVIAEGWQRLQSRSMKDNSLNVSGILSTISSAYERKAKALGLLKDKHELSGPDGQPMQVILQQLNTLLDKPVKVHSSPAVTEPGV